MSLAVLLIETVTISLSGALAPGPLTAAVAACGAKRGWREGFLAALGHTIVELPLVILLALGLVAILSNILAQKILGFIGSGFLALFAYLTAKEAYKPSLSTSEQNAITRFNSGFTAGFLLSALNPFFIAWWLTIGLVLVRDALIYAGLIGVLVMHLSHVWIDYAWLSVIAGGARITSRNINLYRAVMMVLAVMLAYFALDLLIRTLTL